MKNNIYLTFCLLTLTAGHAIAQYKKAVEITPKVLMEIKAAVEKQLPAYKNDLIKKDVDKFLSADQIAFSVDTFRINKIREKRMDLDFTTAGMNDATYAMADDYDKLMNKYYNKLLKSLKSDDKKILINAQRAWLAYRDAEGKLIGTITGEYSGGGTMQTNIASSDYAVIIVKRTVTIFQYYDSVTNKM